MPVAKLTKRFVDTTRNHESSRIYYDNELKGFGVKVTPSGVKSWCVEYRPGGGGRSTAKRRMVLGSTGTLTPDQARLAARKILAAVALVKTPQLYALVHAKRPPSSNSRIAISARRPPQSLSLVASSTIASTCASMPAPSSAISRLDKVASADVAKMHRRIGQTRPVTANRVDGMRRLCLSLCRDMQPRRTAALIPPPVSRLSANNVARDFLPPRNWLVLVKRSGRLKLRASLGKSTKASPPQSTLPKIKTGAR